MEGKGDELKLQKNKFYLKSIKPYSAIKSVCNQIDTKPKEKTLIMTPTHKIFDDISEVSTQVSPLACFAGEVGLGEQETNKSLKIQLMDLSRTLDFEDCQVEVLPKKRIAESFDREEGVFDRILSRMDETIKESFFDGKSMIVHEDLDVITENKKKNFAFLDKIKQQATSNKGSYNFVKGFLRANTDDEPLEVLPPRTLEGFIAKRSVKNPRDLMIENLRNRINEKKTSYLLYEDIFSKPVTDLPGKKMKLNESIIQVENFGVNDVQINKDYVDVEIDSCGAKEENLTTDSASTAGSLEMIN